ncbi:MAG: hypothetical protein COY38_03560 [Candidatus Aenigmarchaeota archaeon CG_4_10_14_0_8_um_filter_37_24]|nr:MAG: hypothetical protein AUJ50_04500 [Candidatus Aenigmarchaeota archaeon CG1_02_38_14]PIV68229.1 MAG: hypothetical protein COS07_04625 [Candidatus Aenigmarchaeota archaeon CG01_land_8_20_14_3_00_37_9]PIW41216.1 MAG: hypothetical protein COW21_03030 [Candidatus Aenigmarchaeota archaeon CG15_BIG_FIL_POST_REV_8_21_14_020_37_27]PIX50246.1 MAG: hypothetical protein COZ52_05245 [Candidatus Aenigmarchaeota archaeon CG_4_8_14_3_um_filter_37_24]PIY34992.1 MAG: hypothetical protein COZ04_04875 [Cand
MCVNLDRSKFKVYRKFFVARPDIISISETNLKFNCFVMNMPFSEAFPRVPWILESYASELGTTKEDLLEVKVIDNDYPSPLYTSRNRYEARENRLLRCSWAAGTRRAEQPTFRKSLLIPIYGGKIYFDPITGERIIIYVDDHLTQGTTRIGAWKTVSVLQEAFAQYCVLGGDPDATLRFFQQFQEQGKEPDLVICDHNLWCDPREGGNRYKDDDYRFRYGWQFIEELRRQRFRVPPIISHSDDAILPGEWMKIPEYKVFVPKYDVNGKSPIENLIDAINLHVR